MELFKELQRILADSRDLAHFRENLEWEVEYAKRKMSTDNMAKEKASKIRIVLRIMDGTYEPSLGESFDFVKQATLLINQIR